MACGWILNSWESAARLKRARLLELPYRRAAEQLGLATMPLISHAGHDAQALASLCSVGMIFVPSVRGTSHSPGEFTPWQDCVNGANLLLQTVLRMAA